MTFDHHAHHMAGSSLQLISHRGEYIGLAAEILVRVGMAAVHHQTILQARLAQFRCSSLNGLQVVVAALMTATQHQMTIRVAGRAHDRSMAVAVDPQKMMRFRCRLHRVDGDGGAAVSAVLVADRHRQA